MIITLHDLIYSGTHGATEKERLNPQPFKITIKLTPWKAAVGDDIADAADYRLPKKIAQAVIEGPHKELIETLAGRVAERIIAEDASIRTAEVTVQKTKIWENGAPSVTVTRHAPVAGKFIDFDIDNLVYRLTAEGGATMPFLAERLRADLALEADRCAYAEQPTVVGKHKVREELSSCSEFPEDSRFIRIKEDITDFFNWKLSQARSNPFGSMPISFNEISLQKYRAGSIGISPHMDNLSCTNLILVITLKGKGDFFLCDDREKNGSRQLPLEPGMITVMRAPGFFGSIRRPFHYITNITEERIVFSMRNNTKKK